MKVPSCMKIGQISEFVSTANLKILLCFVASEECLLRE